MEKTTTISDLPSDILVDILSRLNVNTIFHCCKYVCKAWNMLLSNSYFAKIHLTKSPDIILFLIPRKVLCMYDFNWRINDNDHDFQICKWVRIVGSCNGLLCLWNYSINSLLICNPITRECVFPPDPKPSRLCGFGYTSTSNTYKVGFGYTSTSNEYKVVRIYVTSDGIFKCEIYTLGSKNWRRIEGSFPCPNQCVKRGVTINGGIHWIIDDNNEPDYICCFDIKDERFNRISPPCQKNDNMNLSLLGNCLSISYLYYFNDDTCRLDIWVMKVHGRKKSWSKDHVIRDSVVTSLIPIRIEEDGGILVFNENEETMRVYDPTGIESKEMCLFDNCEDVIPFVASFVSLKEYGEIFSTSKKVRLEIEN